MGWSKEALTFIVLSFGYWLTGGLHLDGLMDTADGLAAGKDKCIEAMEDSRVGASGVSTLLICIFLQIAALIQLNSLVPFALPIATFWGRVAPLWAIENFPYLKNKGHGSFHSKNKKGIHEIKPSLFFLLIIFLFLRFFPPNFEIIKSSQLIIGLAIGILPAIIVPEFLGKRLGGHNGDSYGASLVIVETFTLLILTMIW